MINDNNEISTFEGVIPPLDVTSCADQHEFFIILQTIVNTLVQRENDRGPAKKIVTDISNVRLNDGYDRGFGQ